MLNISLKSVSKYIDKSQYESYKRLDSRSNSKSLLKILVVMFFIFVIFMFLPWTQNIRSTGKVTTLNPYDKPQNIQISNTEDQRDAKLKSADAYSSKRQFLKDQMSALLALQESKLKQLDLKMQQLDLEAQSVIQDISAAETKIENATNQLDRMQQMYDKGIKSLTDLESKRFAKRQANAKLVSQKNKLQKVETEKLNIKQEIELTLSDYEQKIAKVESEINSADSYRYTLMGESSKLESKLNQLEQRQQAFVITSPISGRINKVLKNGIGEYVKTQDNIATIVPTDYQKAVELYIEPYDMPLIQKGKNVRIQFDGWPAIVFSGWPDNSFGTYNGLVYAIDNDISENGKYRILVIEDGSEKTWPDLIRIGSGARGLLLLNDVKVYYEIWRNLNGFPPDFYNPEKSEKVKNKVPLRKVK